MHRSETYKERHFHFHRPSYICELQFFKKNHVTTLSAANFSSARIAEIAPSSDTQDLGPRKTIAFFFSERETTMALNKLHNCNSELFSDMTIQVVKEPRGSASCAEFEMKAENCPLELEIGRPFSTFSVGSHLYAAVGPLADHRNQLFPSENDYVSNAVLKRQIEFSSGRYYAREALRSLGHPSVEIRTTSARAPLWPDGIIGSISHSEQIAAAIVGYWGRIYRGIGLDVEKKGRVTSDLLPLILTEKEQSRLELTADDSETATIIFSAKEAVYKAINPIVGLMIDFCDVEILLETNSKTFRATYLGNDSQNKLIESGLGRYIFMDNHVISLFFIT